MGTRLGRFRGSLVENWPVLPYVAASIGLATFLQSCLDADTGVLQGLHDALVAGAVSTVAVLLLVVVAVALCRVEVFEGGIRGQNKWGRAHAVGWSSMTDARHTSFYGVPYLWVSTADPKVELWLPSSIAMRAEFRSLVLGWAGADHPLSLAVAEPPAYGMLTPG